MPKVLIKNDSNDSTWYHGMVGAVFPVTKIKDFHYFVPDEVTPDGGELGPYGVHFPDGELLYTRNEYNEINRELLRLREEVVDLVKANNYYKGVIKKKSDDLSRCANEYEKRFLIMENAQEERQREWEKKLAEAPEKVKLPREVAESIQSFVNDGRDVDYITQCLTCYSLEHHLTERVRTLREYARKNGFNLISALVNGYTVEETDEDKLVARYKNAMQSGENLRAEDIRSAVELLGYPQLIERLDEIDAEMPF